MKIKLIIFTMITMLVCGCTYETTAAPRQEQSQKPKIVHIIEATNKSEFEQELGDYLKAGWELRSFQATTRIRPNGYNSFSDGVDRYIAVVTQRVVE